MLWRRRDRDVQVLIAHMGGPLWSRKDDAAWSVPKGEYVDPEEPLTAALREWEEELGVPLPVEPSPLLPLGEVRQRNAGLLLPLPQRGSERLLRVDVLALRD